MQKPTYSVQQTHKEPLLILILFPLAFLALLPLDHPNELFLLFPYEFELCVLVALYCVDIPVDLGIGIKGLKHCLIMGYDDVRKDKKKQSKKKRRDVARSNDCYRLSPPSWHA